jgi:hypothetical protein
MDLFVGREAELTEALRLLFTRGEGSVIETSEETPAFRSGGIRSPAEQDRERRCARRADRRLPRIYPQMVAP